MVKKGKKEKRRGKKEKERKDRKKGKVGRREDKIKRVGRINKARREMINFIIKFSTFSIVMYLFYYYFIKDTIILISLKNGTALILASLLSMLGFKSIASGNIVSMDGFSMEIIDECTAIFSSIIYISGVLAYPANMKQKLLGMIGVPILYIIDLMRLIILAFVGVKAPSFFEYVHVYLWQATFIIFVILVFVLWINKVNKREYVA